MDKRHQEVVDAFAAFEPKYRENLIFLPEGLASDLAKLKQEHVSITNVFRFMVHKKDNAMAMQQYLQLLERLNEDLPKSMAALQAAMRAILDGKQIIISKITVMNTEARPGLLGGIRARGWVFSMKFCTTAIA